MGLGGRFHLGKGWMAVDRCDEYLNDYCIFLLIIRCFISNMSKCNVGAIRTLVYVLRVCTGDNPLAKARGLSSRTNRHTTQYITRVARRDCCSMLFKERLMLVRRYGQAPVIFFFSL